MDCQSFIKEIIHEYLAFPNYYDDMASLLDATIDDYVGHNDIETNKKIVTEFAGDVYDAIQLYEFHLGNACDLHKGTKSKFYQQLAYVSMFAKIYPQIQSIIDDISVTELSDDIDDEELSSFSWSDVNDDIVDMFYETIQSYKKHKAEENLYSEN